LFAIIELTFFKLNRTVVEVCRNLGWNFLGGQEGDEPGFEWAAQGADFDECPKSVFRAAAFSGRCERITQPFLLDKCGSVETSHGAMPLSRYSKGLNVRPESLCSEQGVRAVSSSFVEVFSRVSFEPSH
jgi:hypothetical protein